MPNVTQAIQKESANDPMTISPPPSKNELNALAPRPRWNQGGIWMGASCEGLWRIARQYRFQVAPRYWLDFGFDSCAAAFNSVLRGCESLLWCQRLRAMELPTDPVFVLGHWRTGTTLLHELLALDPRHRAPTTYECLLPAHFLLTDRWLRPWTEFALPKTRGFDNISVTWSKPQEDELALALLGQGSPYTSIAFPNAERLDHAYLDLDELTEDEQERWRSCWTSFLKRLLALRPGRLIIKSPTHTCRVPMLLKVFPQAKFVYVVRDPTPVYLSTIKLWRTLFAVHGYQRPTFTGLEEEVLANFAHFHERFEATKSLIPPENLLTVKYESLVADPRTMLAEIYRRLDLGDDSQAKPPVEDYLQAQRDYQRNQHEFDEATKEKLRQRWRGYYELHGY